MSTIEYGSPISFAGGAAFTEPLWRFAVTDLDGRVLTFLDKLASDRQITFHLNEATEITCTVPSDSPEVNILHTDGFPFIAEGVRQIYCYRRESNLSPYYYLRASGVILQVDDAAASDDARTRITAWDSWKMLELRPVMSRTAPWIPVGIDGITYDTSFTAAEIVADILTQSFNSANARKTLYPGIPSSTLRAFIDSTYTSVGTFGVPASSEIPYKIEQGTSVAAALQELCAQGYLDILFVPYRNSPTAPNGLFAQMFMYSEAFGGLGAGGYNYAAQFSWDRPGRNTVGMDNMYDGTGRANIIDYYNGQGGPPVIDGGAGLASSVGAGVMAPDSLAHYGEYWAQQWFPAQVDAKAAILAIAQNQLDLRKNYKETLTVNPAASGRAPDPFLDYGLGDRVPVYASNRMRQSLPPGGITVERGGADGVTSANTTFVAASGNFTAGDVGKFISIFTRGVFRVVAFSNSTTVTISGAPNFGAFLPWQIGVSVTVPVFDPPILAWQRIYGIPLVIDDNGTETVSELIVGPVGGPVIGAPPVGSLSVTTSSIGSALRPTQRVGSVVVSR